MVEQGIQGDFINFVTGKNPLVTGDKSHINIYKELVFYRFSETLANAYPVFRQTIGSEIFSALVRDYIQNHPKNPFVWKMPNEFLQFCKNHKLLSDFAFADDILWYEWCEIELLMGNFQRRPIEPFSWINSWKFSDSVRINQLNFQVHLKDFSRRGVYPIILYYNFTDHKIYYLETTQFMMDLITGMGKVNARAALNEISISYNVPDDEIESLVTRTLNDYCFKKILVRV